MARVKMVLTRPNVDVLWYLQSEEYTEEVNNYVQTKYNFGIPSSTPTFSFDSLTQTRNRIGSLDLCTEFYDELNNPDSILYRRKAYYDAVGITYEYTLIP
jgi:hypothetical protein